MDKSNEKKFVDKEAYLLAARDPWLVWRLRALEAGYVPPLLPRDIPPNLINLFPREKEYEAKPLIDHAEKIKEQEKHLLSKKMWMAIFLSVLFILGLTYSYNFRDSIGLRIGILDALLPHSEYYLVKDYKK